MPQSPPHLLVAANQPILRYLEGSSAHSDVAEALGQALQPLGSVQTFCPDPARYRSLIASTNHLVFAFALGLDTVGFRLDERMKARALATGASPLPAGGPEWVTFTLFRDDWPKVDLTFWARKAYAAARESPAG